MNANSGSGKLHPGQAEVSTSRVSSSSQGIASRGRGSQARTRRRAFLPRTGWDVGRGGKCIVVAVGKPDKIGLAATMGRDFEELGLPVCDREGEAPAVRCW